MIYYYHALISVFVEQCVSVYEWIKTQKKGRYPSTQSKYATAGPGKQDSPHEGFCSPSQTPYSPEGEAEFNVARAEHPVLQKKKKKNSKKHTQHSQRLGLTLLNPAPAAAYIPSSQI